MKKHKGLGELFDNKKAANTAHLQSRCATAFGGK